MADVWNSIDLSLIALSWASFSLYFYRVFWAEKVKNDFDLNFQTLNYWYRVFTYCLAACAFLITIRFAKLFRNDARVYSMFITLERSFRELFSFTLMFLVCWFTFAQLMYLLFNSTITGYESLTTAMETLLLQVNLGIFSAKDYEQARPILGPLIFVVYNVVVVFALLNLLIAIIIHAFQLTRESGTNGEGKNADVVGFIAEKLSAFVNDIVNRHRANVNFTKKLSLLDQLEADTIEALRKFREVKRDVLSE